jgi:hypothetical protein
VSGLFLGNRADSIHGNSVCHSPLYDIYDMLHRKNVLEGAFNIRTVLEIAFSFFFFSCHELGLLASFDS